MTSTFLPSAVIPCDIDAEKRLCGILILENGRINDTILSVSPDHFYSIQYRYIYSSICQLFIDGNPVTPETIANHLKFQDATDGNKLTIVGGNEAIIKTIEEANTDEFDFWSGRVKKKYEERQLVSFAQEALQMALSNPESVKGVRNKIEERLVSLSGERVSSSFSIETALPDLDSRIQRYIDNPDAIIGIESGIARLDKDIDGFQPGNVSIVYAPSSRFKSLFVQNLGWRFASQGVPGLWFTTEMPRVQVMERLLQLETGLNFKWLRRDKRILEHKGRIHKGMERLRTFPIYFCDSSSLDVAEIRSEVNRHKRWNDIQYVIVDLVDHVFSSRFKDEMVNNQRVVMSSMKQIAKDFDVHIVLVSHISKGNEQSRKNADLDVEEMTGSAAKYQDVDVSMSISPVAYGESGRMQAMQREDIIYAVAESGKLDVLLSITKNRHGELDRFILTLDFNKGGIFSETGWIEVKNKVDTEDNV